MRIHLPEAATKIRVQVPDRSLRSRMMRTWKFPKGLPRKFKSRWCVAGQDNPDLKALCGERELAALQGARVGPLPA